MPEHEGSPISEPQMNHGDTEAEPANQGEDGEAQFRTMLEQRDLSAPAVDAVMHGRNYYRIYADSDPQSMYGVLGRMFRVFYTHTAERYHHMKPVAVEGFLTFITAGQESESLPYEELSTAILGEAEEMRD